MTGMFLLAGWLLAADFHEAMAMNDWSSDNKAFSEALSAPTRSVEIAESNDIYAPLLGSWDVEAIDYDEAGRPSHTRGEWHFARVLEGRAVQDVWIAPSRTERAGASRRNNRYGSSLRFPVPGTDHWKLIWLNPVSGAETHLVGRREGKKLVHEGMQPDGALLRWTFEHIDAYSFSWKGEASSDAGKTWVLEAEFHGKRQKSDAPRPLRSALWISPDGQRIEHVSLTESAGSIHAEGLIVRRHAPQDTRVRYRVELDPEWRVRALHMQQLGGDNASFSIFSDTAGHWRTSEGTALTELNGCVDVDIHASPFTNTIAIRRLGLNGGESAAINAAFVHVDAFAAEPARQRYTRLPPSNGNNRYRYEGLDSGFVTELPVDEDGLLIEYPDYFDRKWSN